MSYALYPGCSLESSSVGYRMSVDAVARRLGLELREIDDWNCCGATEYFTLNRAVAYSLIARNLALVPRECDQLVAPCSACCLNLRKTDHLMRESARWRRRINEALAAGGLHYSPGRLRVRHLLDVLYTDVGERRLRDAVVRPLSGLRVAPYYGCQIVRPLDGDDPEQPTRLDALLRWIGCDVVDYGAKTHCCGGHMTQISEPEALELIRRLLQLAADREADALACVCPMCQLNLDAYQSRVNARFGTHFALPVVFFTQLVGLALGFGPAELGLDRVITPAAERLDLALVRGPRHEPQTLKPAPRKRPGGGPELPTPRRKG